MQTALLIVVESHPPNQTVRRVAIGRMGPGLCRITVCADFLEQDEPSGVTNAIDVEGIERTGT